jgi:hypothetical protein
MEAECEARVEDAGCDSRVEDAGCDSRVEDAGCDSEPSREARHESASNVFDEDTHEECDILNVDNDDDTTCSPFPYSDPRD